MYKYRYLGKKGINIPFGISVKHHHSGDIVDTSVPIEELGFAGESFDLISPRNIPSVIQEQIAKVSQNIEYIKKSIENKTEEFQKGLTESRQALHNYEKDKKRLETELKSLTSETKPKKGGR